MRSLRSKIDPAKKHKLIPSMTVAEVFQTVAPLWLVIYHRTFPVRFLSKTTFHRYCLQGVNYCCRIIQFAFSPWGCPTASIQTIKLFRNNFFPHRLSTFCRQSKEESRGRAIWTENPIVTGDGEKSPKLFASMNSFLVVFPSCDNRKSPSGGEQSWTVGKFRWEGVVWLGAKTTAQSKTENSLAQTFYPSSTWDK